MAKEVRVHYTNLTTAIRELLTARQAVTDKIATHAERHHAAMEQLRATKAVNRRILPPQHK